MEQDMVLISRDECEQLLTYLERARGYCRNARPVSFPMTTEEIYSEPTSFYSGASGYALTTMGLVIDALERHM